MDIALNTSISPQCETLKKPLFIHERRPKNEFTNCTIKIIAAERSERTRDVQQPNYFIGHIRGASGSRLERCNMQYLHKVDITDTQSLE